MLITIFNCIFYGFFGIMIYCLGLRAYETFVKNATIKDGKKIVRLPWDMELHIKLDDAKQQSLKARRKS